jgi:hypothetical protein
VRYLEPARPDELHVSLLCGEPQLIGHVKGLVRNSDGKTSGTGMIPVTALHLYEGQVGVRDRHYQTLFAVRNHHRVIDGYDVPGRQQRGISRLPRADHATADAPQ